MAGLKNMPVLPKILAALLVFWVVYKIGATRHATEGSSSYTPSPVEERRTGGSDEGRQAAAQSGGSSRALAQYEGQLSQLMAQVNRCVQETNAFLGQQAQAAANGQFLTNEPVCNQYMPQWTAQAAVLVTYITRIKTGNMHLTVCEANAGLRGCEGLEASAPPSASPSEPSDDGTEAVERTTRQGIRGSTIYTDGAGEQHELPTREYYYRDRASGQLVGSDSPNPPDNVHDYEQLQPER